MTGSVRRPRRLLLFGLVCLGLAASRLPLRSEAAATTPARRGGQPPAQAGTACAQLAALTVPNLTVRAEAVEAGSLTPAGTPGGGPARVLKVPALCRVMAVATPTPDSQINIEVWLPLA